jgi:hypothetical protein
MASGERMSSHNTVFWLCVCATLSMLSGCTQAPPPPYSADYSYMAVASPTRPFQRWALVPNACLEADPSDSSRYLGPHAPPGCANAYNLMRMTEREGDLVRGRRLGAAPAAPSARAAQRYINGGTGSAVYGPTAPLGGGLARPGGTAVTQRGDEERPALPGGGHQYGTDRIEGAATAPAPPR